MAEEDAFAIEAQEEAILSRSEELRHRDLSTRLPSYISATGSRTTDDEERPLLASKSPVGREGRNTDAPPSYGDAITKPWTAFEGLPWYKRPSVRSPAFTLKRTTDFNQIFWLLPAFFPFCLAWGGLIVPKTYLILNLICRDYLSERSSIDPSFHTFPVVLGEQNEQCRDAHVQALVARFQLYSSLLMGIFSAIVTPYMGALSDRFGRKKVIAFSTLGAFVGEIITIIVGTHPDTLSVYWLLLGYLLDGMSGSFTTNMSISLAYASDCTAPERRNVAIGFFHATLFSGIAFGPILAAFLMQWSGTIMIVFYVAVGCHLFFITFLLLFIPESVSQERQLHAREKHRIKKQETQDDSWWSTIKKYNLFEPLWILRPRGSGTSSALRRNLSLLASIDTIMFGVGMGTLGIIVIYPQYVFGWDPIQSSKFLSIVNICRVTGLLLVLPVVTRIFRGPVRADRQSGHRGADMLDIRIVRVAILLDLVGYAGYAMAKQGGMFVVSAMIAAFAGIGSPTLSSAITAHVPPDRTGQVLGAMGLLHALARVIAPTVFNLIYSLTVATFTQTVFVCLGSLFLVVFVLSWFLKPGSKSLLPLACMIRNLFLTR
jgi:MFS family permease